MSIDTLDIDLHDLSEKILGRIPAGEPKGYLRGKSALREVVRSILDCSELEAEEIIDTLESRGYLRYEGDPAERSQAYTPWVIDPSAEL